MYYTGLNPDDMKEVYIPRDKLEKQTQRALLQFNRPENYDLVKKALIENHRSDLIGKGANCLIDWNKPTPKGKGKATKK